MIQIGHKGWIKIWHKLTDDPLWLEEPFTKGQAWVDLILIATTVVTETPGRVYCSVNWLANRWKWSRDKVRNYLKRLENDGKIKLNNDRQKNRQYFRQDFRHLLTVENYSIYQNDRQQNRQQNRQNSRHIVDDIGSLPTIKVGKEKRGGERTSADSKKRIPEQFRPYFESFDEFEEWRKRL